MAWRVFRLYACHGLFPRLSHNGDGSCIGIVTASRTLHSLLRIGRQAREVGVIVVAFSGHGRR